MNAEYMSPARLRATAPWLADDTLWKELPLAASPYGSLFMKGARAVLYHSLTMEALAGDEVLRSLWQFLSSPGGALFSSLPEKLRIPELLRMLFAREFIVPLGEDRHRGLRALRQRARADLSPFSKFMMQLTAFPEKGTPGREMFSCPGLARRMELFFARAAEKGVRRAVMELQIAGNQVPLEPVRFVAPLAREYGDHYAFDTVLLSVKVPASLADDELSRLCASSGIKVVLSWDGGSRIGSHPRFSRALEGYRNMQRLGVRPSLSCSFTADLLFRIEQLVEFFASDLECASLDFSFPGSCRGKGKRRLPAELASDRLFRLYERLRLYGVSLNPPADKVKAFAGRKPLFIDKDWWERGEGRLTRVVSPLFSDRDYRFLPVFRASCQFCPAIGLCGSGAPGRRAEGAEPSADPWRCRFQLLTLQWLIDEMLRAMKWFPSEGSMMLLPGGCP